MKDVFKGFLISFIPGLIILILAFTVVYNYKNSNTNVNTSGIENNVSVEENENNENNEEEKNKEVVEVNYNIGDEITFEGEVKELNYNKDNSIIIKASNITYKVMGTEEIRLDQTIWIRGIVTKIDNTIEVDTRELKVIN